VRKRLQPNALHVVAMLCRNLPANGVYLINDRILVHGDHHDFVSACCAKRIGLLLGRAVK